MRSRREQHDIHRLVLCKRTAAELTSLVVGKIDIDRFIAHRKLVSPADNKAHGYNNDCMHGPEGAHSASNGITGTGLKVAYYNQTVIYQSCRFIDICTYPLVRKNNN